MTRERLDQARRSPNEAPVAIHVIVAIGAVAGGVYLIHKSEETLSSSGNDSASVICTDPKGDEHPTWVDFTKVSWERINDQIRFGFFVVGNPQGPNTILRTDTSYAIVFVNSQTREGEYYAYAFGDQKTAGVGVQVRQFSNPKTGFDQNVPTIPNQEAKNDPIIFQAGSEAINTTFGEVSFTVPASIIDPILENREMWPWTAEGTGHGNEGSNGIQSFNKDHCQKGTPTPTQTESPTITPTTVPSVSPTPPKTPTPIITTTPTGTSTQTPEQTVSPTPTQTREVTPTPTATPEITAPPPQTESPTPKVTSTPVRTPQVTKTPESSPTKSPTPSPSNPPATIINPPASRTPQPAITTTPGVLPPTGGQLAESRSIKTPAAIFSAGALLSIIGIDIFRRKLRR